MLVYGWIFRIVIALIFSCHVLLEAKSPSKEVKDAVAPYLMPEDHPIKSLLDDLFSSSRIILNLNTLKKAGFKETKPRKFTKLIVTTHPKFPGYVFKLYLDAQRYHKNLPEHHFWILRVQGAKKVRQVIQSHHLALSFKVPMKWIYALPKHPAPPYGYLTKYYILVEEDMDLLSLDENQELWASRHVTPALLDDLFIILKTVGLRDCAKPDNIPFSIDGRIAFIDTQTFNRKVNYKKLIPHLSKSNQTYWKSLISE